MRARRLTTAFGLLLVLATAAAYYRVLGHEFVFDDKPYILLNEHVRAGLSARNVAWGFASCHSANWHPLTWASHMLDCTMFDLNPAGHHFVNLLLHVANALLLFSLMTRMTRSIFRSAFVAALFALHPLHVESVAWVAERKDVLSTLFLLLTLWAYARYAERPGRGRYAAVFLLLTLGLMSKPMLVTVPFMLLLLDYWPLRRFEGCGLCAAGTSSGNAGGSKSKSKSSSLIVEKIPLLALAAASGGITYVAQQRGQALGAFDQYSVGLRAANAVVSYVAYVGKMVWPRGFAVFYPHPGGSIPMWQVVAAAMLLLALTVMALRLRERRPYLMVGWLWYLGTLVPVIGLVQVGAQAMADRYTYIPLIGLFVVIAWGTPDLVGYSQRNVRMGEGGNGRECRQPSAIGHPATGHRPSAIGHPATSHRPSAISHPAISHRPSAISHQPSGHRPSAISHQPFPHSSILPIAAVVSLVGLAVCTWFQVGYWRDSFSLFGRAAAVTRGNWLMHNNLGVALAADDELDRAIEHYKAAIRAKPEYADAHNNLGNAFARQGRIEEAVREYRRAISLDPRNARAHYNLGAVLAGRGQLDHAIASFSEAVRIDPTLRAAQDALRITRARRDSIGR